ncbi:rhomboid family intramembrane serine protease [Halomicrobium salinisoli]|uniref:rhomboid family intramembrane serine protease n=1 Tax=Halomicrobium salinisoli TaxID=2878391 RepID=UPI001CF052C7|nr:rhomboid family intramembrane serine protease [Halomicrobium salinisoli]
MGRRLADSPTVTLLVALVVVFALQQIVTVAAGRPIARSLFTLSAPITTHPWTVVTAVYAHSSLSHLAANAAALALAGLLLERRTTPARFHAFFLTSGALAGLAQVSVSAMVGPFVPGMHARVSVLGASGAVFALFGYLLASNGVTEEVLGGVSLGPRLQVALLAGVAVAVTLATASPRAALIAHFTGFLLGLLAGRIHVLRPPAVRRRAGPV